jgi:hypothetical protein
LNDDTEHTPHEFVDFTPCGEVNPTSPERPFRKVCEPNFEAPTEDAANASTTDLWKLFLNGSNVIKETHAHFIRAGLGPL